MRALVLPELSGPRALRLREIPEPSSQDRVLIEVRAAGVCYPDLLLSYGRYQVRAEPPFVPGSEIAG